MQHTLAYYRRIALLLSGRNEGSKAVRFLDAKIAEQGSDMEVVADESQMLILIGHMLYEDRHGE